jgi:hypothetical protein
MSGDDKNMNEILNEIREIVAEDEGKPVVPGLEKIDFLTGLLATTPFIVLAVIWERKLNGWLWAESEVDNSALMMLIILFILDENIFRQPRGHGDWSVLLATLFLATMAYATTAALVDGLFIAIAPAFTGLVSDAIEILSGFGTMFATLWIASRLTRDRNLILRKEDEPDAREGGAG